MNAQQSQPQEAADRLIRELALAGNEISESLFALGSPLRELVQARIDAAGPPSCAALVLCAGYNGSQDEMQPRLHLAAALELLHTGLDIHQLLLESDRSSPPYQAPRDQLSFIGSTVLAGDFCFSRAAQLAARTENPTIVRIFAQALQDVSEERLRALNASADRTRLSESSSRDLTLMRSGALAAVELSGLDEGGRTATLRLTDAILDHRTLKTIPSAVWEELLSPLPASRQFRWRAYRTWMDSAGMGSFAL